MEQDDNDVGKKRGRETDLEERERGREKQGGIKKRCSTLKMRKKKLKKTFFFTFSRSKRGEDILGSSM